MLASWDDAAVAVPNVLREGDLFKMWYGGFDGNSFKTGYATAQLDYIRKNLGNPPEKFKLRQNYPNPFNPTTMINFQLSMSDHVVLKIFDILGREITTLVNQQLSAGEYEVSWNATDLPSGIYYCQLQAGDYQAVKKMILMK